MVVFPADKSLWGIHSPRPHGPPRHEREVHPHEPPFGRLSHRRRARHRTRRVARSVTLEELAAASLAFTLADGEKKTQDLRLASVEVPALGRDSRRLKPATPELLHI